MTSSLDMFYKEVDALIPKASNRTFRIRGQEDDDIAQEARMAAWKSLQSYDFNKARGALLPYLRTIVTNTCNAMYAHGRRMRRNPHQHEIGPDGRPTAVLQYVREYDTASGAVMSAKQTELTGAEEQPISAEIEPGAFEREGIARVTQFCLELSQKLDNRSRSVLFCRLEPPQGLEDLMATAGEFEEPSNVSIAKHLGLGKNQVDWAWYNIRNTFMELAEDDRFADLFEGRLEQAGWPAIHVSKGSKVHVKFVQRTIAKRRLDPHPIGPQEKESCSRGARTILPYPWGAVLCLHTKDEVWTAVIEGKLSVLSGEVIGGCGVRKALPIDGYKRLARALASGAP